MKKLIGIATIILVLSCSGEDLSNCFQNAGQIVEREYNFPEFSKVRIEGEVRLILKQGTETSVRVSSGEKLFDKIEVFLDPDGETLVIRDKNNCNLVRDYGLTVVNLTAINLTEIRNSSSLDVEGVGLLSFPQLLLRSDTSGGIEDVRKGGDFYLNLNCNNLVVTANGQSAFFISGTAENATITFGDEQPRFEGTELEINKLKIFQVSANKMIVNPQEEITGDIRGTGDVISVNRPTIVEVEEFSLGRLIFQD